MTYLAPCGRDCGECTVYGSKCEGCLREMRHSPYVCEVYSCVNERRLSSCNECEVEDCGTLRSKSVCPLLVMKEVQVDLGI